MLNAYWKPTVLFYFLLENCAPKVTAITVWYCMYWLKKIALSWVYYSIGKKLSNSVVHQTNTCHMRQALYHHSPNDWLSGQESSFFNYRHFSMSSLEKLTNLMTNRNIMYLIKMPSFLCRQKVNRVSFWGFFWRIFCCSKEFTSTFFVQNDSFWTLLE